MDVNEIRRTWRRLIWPFAIGLLLLFCGALFNSLGSNRPTPQTLSLFIGVFGTMLSLFTGHKMFKFHRWLQEKER